MVDPYNNQDDDTVVEFKPRSKRTIEHVDSSTIVEKLELTPELRAEFEAAGYTIEEDDEDDQRNYRA